jgi:hypothetical protein
MSSSNPPPLEQLGKRPFAFYPAVLNIEHNEWQFLEATWSEVLVENVKTGQHIWVPRRLLGEISRIEQPVMIVGLTKEMEYKAGALWPHERRVLEIPRAGNERTDALPAPPVKEPPSVLGVRMDPSENRIGRLIGVALVAGVLLCFIVVSLFRGRTDGTNIRYVPVMQEEIGLAPQDDYFAIVRRLGNPSADRWRSEEGSLQYRVLEYNKRGLNVILMGKDRQSARYIGALDSNWKVVHSVELPHAGNTRPMLNGMKRF